MPKHALSDEEIMRCFNTLSELRTNLTESEFLTTVHRMETEGYRLAYTEGDDGIVAVCGYRIYSNFFMGKHLYVDDLVTSASTRSRGHGENMIK